MGILQFLGGHRSNSEESIAASPDLSSAGLLSNLIANQQRGGNHVPNNLVLGLQSPAAQQIYGPQSRSRLLEILLGGSITAAAGTRQDTQVAPTAFLGSRRSQEGATVPGPGAAELPIPAMPVLASDGYPEDLPSVVYMSDDNLRLSPYQVFLRQQIEVFRASEVEVGTHKRGRNKAIHLHQVGIRCRHCAHIPLEKRQKGSTYFPATCAGIYQAAQNMNTMHLQCGLCSHLPEEIRQRFSFLLSDKSISLGAGRPFWEKKAKELGLVDTLDGIRFFRDLRQGFASGEILDNKAATAGNKPAATS